MQSFTLMVIYNKDKVEERLCIVKWGALLAWSVKREV